MRNSKFAEEPVNPAPRGGLGCVANKGLAGADFGSVAMIRVSSEFVGSVASKGVSGVLESAVRGERQTRGVREGLESLRSSPFRQDRNLRSRLPSRLPSQLPSRLRVNRASRVKNHTIDYHGIYDSVKTSISD